MKSDTPTSLIRLASSGVGARFAPRANARSATSGRRMERLWLQSSTSGAILCALSCRSTWQASSPKRGTAKLNVWESSSSTEPTAEGGPRLAMGEHLSAFDQTPLEADIIGPEEDS